jgi:hypothetical protein
MYGGRRVIRKYQYRSPRWFEEDVDQRLAGTNDESEEIYKNC